MLLLDDHAVVCLASGLVDWLVGCLLVLGVFLAAQLKSVLRKQ